MDEPFQEPERASGEPLSYSLRPVTRLRFPTDPIPDVPPARLRAPSKMEGLRGMLRQRRVWVTPLLVGLNVLAFLAEYGLGMEFWTFTRFAQNRFLVWTGEWWRLVTSTFLHAGLAHLFVNMLLLVLVGGFLERLLGWWRYLVLYLASGLWGALFFQIFSSGGDGLGASGAVYGLVGTFLWVRFGWNLRGGVAPTRRFLWWIAFLVVLEQLGVYLLESFSEELQVATSAHFGGLSCGLLLGYFFLASPGWAPWSPSPWQRRLVLGCWVLLSSVSIVLGCAYPFHDPFWRAWRDFRADSEHRLERAAELRRVAMDGGGVLAVAHVVSETVKECLRQERYADAVEIWKRYKLDEDTPSGYMLLYDPLMGAGEDELAGEVLDSLIEWGDAALARAGRSEEGPSPDLLNEMAWWLAMRGTRLDEAKALAGRAVQLLRGYEPGFLERAQYRWTLSAVVNTLGWTELLLGEVDQAIADLQEAAELEATGSNLLYLGWAYRELGRIPEARETARRAGAGGGLTAHEERLLDWLYEELGLE